MLAHASRPARSTFVATLLLIALLGAAFAPQTGAVTRTWVSGVGDDANPCSRTAPCKTLAGAISRTDEGGEINAIDPGGFGAVTITKAITIDLTPVLGGILNTGTTGVIVNAGADDDVVLRGLDIFGAAPGPAGCPAYGGVNGVRVRGARTVRIDDSRISHTQTSGLELTPDNTDVQVFVNRVDISNSCTHGINAAPIAPRTLSVFVRDSTITNAGIGLRVADNAKVRLSGSTLFANAIGVQTVGSGIIDSYTDNQIAGNTTNGAPTNNFAALTVGPQGPAGAQGPAGSAGPKGDPAYKLLLAPASERLNATAGKKVTLRYLATIAANATLSVRRAGKTIATVKSKARSGRNTITWNGRKGKKAAAPGAYQLSLRAAAGDGQTARTTVALKLVAR